MTLTKVQLDWLRAHGIAFTYAARFGLNHFTKGGLHIEMLDTDPRTRVDIVRRPSFELDGEDCNDGENVLIRSFDSLRSALRFLTGDSCLES